MSTLKSNVIEPATGTNLTLGASGDTIDVTSDTLQLNTWKDSGGNTLFTSDGSGNLSSINSALNIGGGPTLILSQTASGSSSISFTSDIDSTYDKYMFVCLNINPATDEAHFEFQVNASGQSGYNEVITSTAFRAQHNQNGSSGQVGYRTDMDQAQGTSFQRLVDTAGNGADESSAGILYLFAPSSTTYVKHFYGRFSEYYYDDIMMDNFIAGYINVTAAITDIQFKFSSGNFDGKIKMYGCR